MTEMIERWRTWWRAWVDFKCQSCGVQWRELGVYYECCGGEVRASKALAEEATRDRSPYDRVMLVGEFDGEFQYLGAYPDHEVPPPEVLALPERSDIERHRAAQDRFNARLRAASVRAAANLVGASIVAAPKKGQRH